MLCSCIVYGAFVYRNPWWWQVYSATSVEHPPHQANTQLASFRYLLHLKFKLIMFKSVVTHARIYRSLPRSLCGLTITWLGMVWSCEHGSPGASEPFTDDKESFGKVEPRYTTSRCKPIGIEL